MAGGATSTTTARRGYLDDEQEHMVIWAQLGIRGTCHMPQLRFVLCSGFLSHILTFADICFKYWCNTAITVALHVAVYASSISPYCRVQRFMIAHTVPEGT